MNSATITCHAAYNYGAVLQTYALHKYLNENGYNNVIIDYRPKYLRNMKKNIITNFVWRLYRIPDDLKFGKEINKFIKRRYKMTDRYVSYKELVDDPPKASVYIVGSDQVWNYKMENGKDKAFFLKFGTEEISRNSYAASIAQNMIPKDVAEQYKSSISCFDNISVREKSAEVLLSEIGIKNVKTVLDPVYLLDKSEWEDFSDKKINNEKYILVYAFNVNKELKEYVTELAKKRKSKVYVINSLIKDYFISSDKHYWGITPEKVIALFRDADYVVTNSFHGLSFSIIFEKQVAVFSKTTGGNSRLFDLMNNMGIMDIKSGGTIDYSIVRKKVAEERNKSYDYIKSIFDGCLHE